jgi:hypothetical protein
MLLDRLSRLVQEIRAIHFLRTSLGTKPLHIRFAVYRQ